MNLDLSSVHAEQMKPVVPSLPPFAPHSNRTRSATVTNRSHCAPDSARSRTYSLGTGYRKRTESVGSRTDSHISLAVSYSARHEFDSRITLVSLSDLGLCDRLQYHAKSLAANNFRVSLVGLKGKELIPPLRTHLDKGNIHVHRFQKKEPATRRGLLARCLLGPLSMAMVVIRLVVSLCSMSEDPEFMLVQSPPALPVLPLVLAVCRVKNIKCLIDWRDLAHLQARRARHRLSAIVLRMIETYGGRMAGGNLCSSEAMRLALSEMGIAATVMYDKPASKYYPRDTARSHALFSKLGLTRSMRDVRISGGAMCPSDLARSTVFTAIGGDGILRAGPLLAVGHSKWTDDEDTDGLIDAVVALDEALDTDTLKLVIIIDGHGPCLARAVARLARLSLRGVRVHTCWLDPTDYAILLGSADVGLSVARPPTGLTVPMPIVDMLGSGLPVITPRFPVVEEVVKAKVTGVCVDGKGQAFSATLAEELRAIIDEGRAANSRLTRLRRNVIDRYGDRSSMGTADRWTPNWNAFAAPMFRKNVLERNRLRMPAKKR